MRANHQVIDAQLITGGSVLKSSLPALEGRA